MPFEARKSVVGPPINKLRQKNRMYYIYFIRSTSHPNQTYIGHTQNVTARLARHNRGTTPHTAKFTPWKLVAHIGFEDKQGAVEFERYMKSGSGHAFAKK